MSPLSLHSSCHLPSKEVELDLSIAVCGVTKRKVWFDMNAVYNG